MNKQYTAHEQDAATAFTKQSVIFDDIYSGNTIIKYKRARVRNVINNILTPGSYILEINAGTGEDALYLAQQGHRVHATDISDGMLQKLKDKVARHQLEDKITTEKCSYTALSQIQHKGPYDLVFSNFGGLNCTDKAADVINTAASLLAVNGYITIVILSPFCLWESLQALRGKFKLAFRRFNAKNGVTAHIEGEYFKCWYYWPSTIAKAVQDQFKVVNIEGLCTVVPPSYFEHFAEKHPTTYRWLTDLENRWNNKWPWKYIGDYYIMTLQKR